MKFTNCRNHQYVIFGYLILATISLPQTSQAAIAKFGRTSIQLVQNDSVKNTSDEAQIKKVLLADAQKQGWYPKIGAITIADGYAIASTYDQVTGGESILKKEQGDWKIVGGTGGAFSQPEELVEIGKVPIVTARRLLQIRQAK